MRRIDQINKGNGASNRVIRAMANGVVTADDPAVGQAAYHREPLG